MHEIERRCEVTDGLPAPGSQVGYRDVAHPTSRQPRLEKAQLGSVIEHVAGNETTATEGRDDEHGDSEAKADWHALEPVRRCADVLPRGESRWRGWDDVVEEAAV